MDDLYHFFFEMQKKKKQAHVFYSEKFYCILPLNPETI